MLNKFFKLGFFKTAMSGGQVKATLNTIRQAGTAAERATARTALEKAAPTLDYSSGTPRLIKPKVEPPPAPAVQPPTPPPPATPTPPQTPKPVQAPVGWDKATDAARQAYMKQRQTGIAAQRNIPTSKPKAQGPTTGTT